MSEEIKQRIADYLSSHMHLRLATVTPEGKPLAHTVTYASEGATVYFISDKTTRKMQNIMNNPNVSYAVDENYQELQPIQGVQMQGIATIVSEKDEAEKAMGMLLKKFPQVAQLPPNPNMVPVKVTPTDGWLIDNTRGFGHRDEISF